MCKTILVPLDGSRAAEIVLPYAGEIAAKLGAEIILARVCESKAADVANVYRLYLEGIKEQVRRQVKDYGPQKEAKVFSKILLGKPADEILHYADESNVGLIAMASRGSSGQGPWLLGNIAAKVLRATGRPVLLIKAPASRAALRQKRLVKRILMPLDGSTLAEAAIPHTEVLSWALGAELVLIQVLMPLTIPIPLGEECVYPSMPQAEESRKASAMAYLDGVGKPLKERGLITSSAVNLGSPADQIIDYAEANAIDLIAMSTHGRSGIGRWVFGSVTHKVLHAGDTPVLVVRAAKA